MSAFDRALVALDEQHAARIGTWESVQGDPRYSRSMDPMPPEDARTLAILAVAEALRGPEPAHQIDVASFDDTQLGALVRDHAVHGTLLRPVVLQRDGDV